MGFSAPPGEQLLIGVTRLGKMCRKRFGMLTSWQNVPRTFFMQISAAITEKYIFDHISTNTKHNSTNKVSIPMF